MKKQLFGLLFFGSFVSFNYGQTTTVDSTSVDKTKISKKFELSVMPFLSYNRNLDFMFGAIPMLMYKTNQKDTISPKSLSGLTAIYTTNKSYFICLFNRWYFKEDTWRFKLFALTGDYNNQFYLTDNETPGFYDYATDATIVSVGAQRKIIPHLFGGLSYTYSNYDTVYEDEVLPEDLTQTNGLEFNMLLDSRNEVYYPTSGVKSQLRYISYPTWIGNVAPAYKIVAEYNQYFPMKNGRDIIAARFSGKFGLGDIAFQQQTTIGGKDIREVIRKGNTEEMV